MKIENENKMKVFIKGIDITTNTPQILKIYDSILNQKEKRDKISKTLKTTT